MPEQPADPEIDPATGYKIIRLDDDRAKILDRKPVVGSNATRRRDAIVQSNLPGKRKTRRPRK